MNEIEVIDAEIVTAKDKNEMIKFLASHHADSAGTQSFCCLIEKGQAFGSWSRKEWFGLKFASFEKTGQMTEVIVSAPLWLLERKGILNLITQIK